MANKPNPISLLEKHMKSTKSKYMFTTRDGKQFGTDSLSEVPKLREAVLKHNEILAKAK